MPDIAPPQFGNLIWRLGAERSYADATEAFWPIYRMAKERLFRIGVRVEKTGDDWRIVFTPRFAPPNILEVVNGILAEVAELERCRAENDRIDLERRIEADRLRAEELARYAAEHAKLLAERLPPAIEAARKTVDLFGEFTVRKDRLRQLIQRFDDPDNVHPLGLNDLAALEDSVHETGLKSQAMFSKIRALKGQPVDWPEADVIDAIQRLTLQDSDHASVDNSIGWNKPDSTSGHWAYAMLQGEVESNRAAAVKLGRILVGKYAVTQLGEIVGNDFVAGVAS